MAAHTCAQGNKVCLPQVGEETEEGQGNWWMTWLAMTGTLCLSVRRTLSKTQFQTSSSACRTSPSDTKVSSSNDLSESDLKPLLYLTLIPCFTGADTERSVLKTMAAMDLDKINMDLVESLLEWIVDGKHNYPPGGILDLLQTQFRALGGSA